MTQNEAIIEAFELLLGCFETLKEQHRGDGLGRRYAILLTMLEPVYAYFMVYIDEH